MCSSRLTKEDIVKGMRLKLNHWVVIQMLRPPLGALLMVELAVRRLKLPLVLMKIGY